MSRERERFDETGKKTGKKIEREGDASVHQQMGINGSNIVMGGRGTNLLNKITPCAACKLLRRRCAEECPFSPYFSPLEPFRFAAVHKVFGASNVSKMLMEVPESQRADAANSLVYEANVRLRDPVYGCMGVISALQQEVDLLQLELNATRTEILRYKYREPANNDISNITAFTPQAPSNLVSTEAAMSVAALPPAPATVSPPPQPPPPPSVMVSSSSSLYTCPASSAMGYESYDSIPSNSVPYFD
ncbi:hypothetical protein Vadar_006189 [Vaccinium darrowii]|uniref:Uncharacterized protein n=1 Tax=Vaccinium darrowii TaxID=229202 RepID=A0ACB7X846_9ERIC|nr:hypothetical protein Vadar_006189 [Vaccinium darrowii]